MRLVAAAKAHIAKEGTTPLALVAAWRWPLRIPRRAMARRLDHAAHGDLMQKVSGPKPNPPGRPLMCQGVSDRFIGAPQNVSLPSEEDGIDIESEFGVICDHAPMGRTSADAAARIRFVAQIHTWSRRASVRRDEGRVRPHRRLVPSLWSTPAPARSRAGPARPPRGDVLTCGTQHEGLPHRLLEQGRAASGGGGKGQGDRAMGSVLGRPQGRGRNRPLPHGEARQPRSKETLLRLVVMTALVRS